MPPISISFRFLSYILILFLIFLLGCGKKDTSEENQEVGGSFYVQDPNGLAIELMPYG